MSEAYERQIAAAAAFLSEHDDYAVVCHINPDGDALGSACALVGVLEKLGKRCSIVCASEIPEVYNYLFNGLKLECEAPQTVVAVDIASLGQWGAAWSKFNRCDLAIDHHSSHENYSQLEVIDPQAAATAVIICYIADALGVKLDKDIANAVFTAVTTDTGCFKYTNSNIESHQIAIRAMEAGADTATINRLMFETKSRSEMEIWRMIMDGIEYKSGGKIAIATVTLAMRKKAGFYNDDLGELASIPRQIEGVVFGITVKQQARGLYKISIRTNRGGSARALAQQFGGGGHENAAGCTIAGTKEYVKAALVSAAETILAQWTE